MSDGATHEVAVVEEPLAKPSAIKITVATNTTPEMPTHSGDLCAVRSVESLIQFLNNGEHVDIPEEIWEDRRRIIAEEDLQKVAGEQITADDDAEFAWVTHAIQQTIEERSLPFSVVIRRERLTRDNTQTIIDEIQSGSEVIVFGIIPDGTPHMFHLGAILEDEHGQYFLSNQRGGNPKIYLSELEATIPEEGFTILVVEKKEEKYTMRGLKVQDPTQPEPGEENQSTPEIIHPEECTLVAPPQIYATISEARSYITDEIPEDGEIILLPYHMEGAQRFTREQLLLFLEHEGNGVDGHGEPKGDRPIAISQIQIHGRTVYAVLVSESVLQENGQPTEDYVYRSDSLDVVPQILERGFFQLPGRVAFRSEAEDVPVSTGRVILALRLSKGMYISHPQDNGLVAVGFSSAHMGSLPKEMQDTLGDLIVYDSQTLTSVDSGTLQRQVLLWGSVAGMLVRIDPSQIDREHTLAVNKERVRADRGTDRQAVEELEEILRATTSA